MPTWSRSGTWRTNPIDLSGVDMDAVLVRFWSHVDKTADCWLWKSRTTEGYGASFEVNGQQLKPHRFSYTVFRGLIPPGFVIDHLCRQPACVRPEHLDVVTNRTNALRGVGATAKNAAKTVCQLGHPLSSRQDRGIQSRYCKTCHNRRINARRAARRSR